MKHLLFVILVAMVMCIASPAIVAQETIPVSEIAIVANVNVTATSISSSDVESIFISNTGKIGEVRLEITILKDGPVHESFLKNYIKKTSSQFLSSWKKLVFSGKAKMPKDFATDEELVKYVASTPRAIGYVHVKTSQNSSVMTDKVKVIAVAQ